MCKEMNS